MKARSRPTGTIGKQPDQAPAQPGYWPKRLLTGHVHSHDRISASPASLFAYHQWILRQIRPNRSNQKGGYNDLPPYSSEGRVWRPKLRRIGLDQHGEPISEEVWAKFQGRLGRAMDNHFRRMTRLDGAPMSLLPRMLGRLVRLAEVRGWLPGHIRHAQGTPAPGDPGRWFIHGHRMSGDPLRACPYE